MNHLAVILREETELDATLGCDSFARATLCWLKGRARSLEVCPRTAKLLRPTEYLTGRFIKVFHNSADASSKRIASYGPSCAADGCGSRMINGAASRRVDTVLDGPRYARWQRL